MSSEQNLDTLFSLHEDLVSLNYAKEKDDRSRIMGLRKFVKNRISLLEKYGVNVVQVYNQLAKIALQKKELFGEEFKIKMPL